MSTLFKATLNEKTHPYKKDFCGNCKTAIGTDEYCSKCGQKNTDGRISIGEFFSVLVNTIFNLESKFFQTIRDIFRPGKLTNEWFKGRHKPYFHPVRLFIVTALILIAALSLFVTENNSFSTGDFEKAQEETFRKAFINEIDNYSTLYLNDKTSKMVLDSLIKTMRQGKIDSGRKTIASFGKKNNFSNLEDKTTEEIIALYKTDLGAELTDSILNVVKSNRRISRDSIELNNLVGDAERRLISNEDFLNLSPNEIADKYEIIGFFKRLHFKQRIRLQKSGKNLLPFVLGNSLWVALLMMPFLAIILKLLYFRREYFYVEHLIFSFHVHAFAFIIFSIICVCLKWIYFHPLIVLFGFLLLFIYLYKSLRRVYQQGKGKTFIKLLIANIIYLFLFFSFALLGLIVSLFLF